MEKPQINKLTQEQHQNNYLQSQIENWSESEIRLVSEIGYSLTLHNRFDEAIIIYEGLLALYPKTLYFYDSLGSLYLEKRDFAKAIACFDKTLETNPNIFRFAKRGEAFFRQTEMKKAREDFQSALLLASQSKFEKGESEKYLETLINQVTLFLAKIEG